MGKKDARLSFWQNFISGGCAGVGSRSITSPLDVVKIMFQVGTSETHQGFFAAFKNIYKKDGIKGFWKGNGVACLRLFPFNALQFSFYNLFKEWTTDPKTGKMPSWASASSGATAGCIATIAVYPLDLIKTRLTIQSRSGTERKYNGIWDCFVKIYKQEGFMALYKGVSASIAGVIPFQGFTFMAYEILSVLWGKPKNKLSGWENFVNGCLAGAFAQTFSFPFDTVRKKMQAQSSAGTTKTDVKFNGLIDCFVQTVKQKGLLGLWSGTIANLAKVAPYAGIMFYIFEYCKRFFLYQNGYTTRMWKEELRPDVNQGWRPEQVKQYLRNLEEQKKTGKPLEECQRIAASTVIERD